MYLLYIRFQIPNSKLYEFNLAIKRLIKWPVYAEQISDSESNWKSFEIFRNYSTKEVMEKELNGAVYENLMGLVKVLGSLKESKLYEIKTKKDLINEF